MPLKIPHGWCVPENSFFDVEPIIDEEDDVISNFEQFTEDLLWIQEMESSGGGWRLKSDGLMVDLGWLPEGNPRGKYVLSLIRGSWDKPIFEYRTKDRYLIQALIDEILFLSRSRASLLTPQHLEEFASSWSSDKRGAPYMRAEPNIK